MKPLAVLTGGTGFLGRHVAEALTVAGWRLRLLVRAAPRPGVPDEETVRGSLAEPAALTSLVEGADVIIHLAGAIRARDRAGFMAVNRDGTMALAAAWRAAAPRARFVMISSLAAREPGLSDYAASKAAGEAALAAAGEAVVLRPCAVYGPGDKATLGIFRAAAWPVQPVLNGPEARVALIHAADVAAAVLAAAGPQMPFGTWELTDGHPEGYSWAEIAAAAASACGRTARPVRVPAVLLRLGGMGGDLAALAGASPILGSGKVREILHPDWGSASGAQPPAALWRPARDIASGFAETVAWYRSAGWLPGGPGSALAVPDGPR